MRFASLGSGSRGNATLVEHGETCLLIDCGFTMKETLKRLARLGKEPDQLDALLVTHEHSDHASGIGPLARKFDIPLYLTPGTYQQSRIGKVEQLELISSHCRFTIKDIEIEPIPVPHDAREPCQYIFDSGARKLGLLTDLGSVTPFVQQSYSGLDGLLLECNHDVEMLENGPYPYALKQRIRGDYGHLSNVQAGQLLQGLELSSLQHLVLSHISEQNNSVELAVSEVTRTLDCERDWLTVADQAQGFNWQMLS